MILNPVSKLGFLTKLLRVKSPGIGDTLRSQRRIRKHLAPTILDMLGGIDSYRAAAAQLAADIQARRGVDCFLEKILKPDLGM